MVSPLKPGAVLVLVRDKNPTTLDIERSGQVLDLPELGELPPDLCAGDAGLVVEADRVQPVVVREHVTDAGRGQLVILCQETLESLLSVVTVNESHVDMVTPEAGEEAGAPDINHLSVLAKIIHHFILRDMSPILHYELEAIAAVVVSL